MDKPHAVAAIYADNDSDFKTLIRTVIGGKTPIKSLPVPDGSAIMIERDGVDGYYFTHYVDVNQGGGSISVEPKIFRSYVSRDNFTKLISWLETCIYSVTNPDSAMNEYAMAKVNPGFMPLDSHPWLNDTFMRIDWASYNQYGYHVEDYPIYIQWKRCVTDTTGNAKDAVWEFSQLSMKVGIARQLLEVLKREQREHALIEQLQPINNEARDDA